MTNFGSLVNDLEEDEELTYLDGGGEELDATSTQDSIQDDP